ncbi:hypothetical protein [Micromonospora sp. RTGN7]|uniref:hypothetical protein n=1 Tax=Micromonospora sp. RTGN7 TaxID=3016526 RepID=UPI0029FF3CC1|nr:hypothetical protein [Micromonospora sp. RTGN7]
MGRTNRASGNDRIDVQAGQIHGRSESSKPAKDTTKDDDKPGRSTNTVTGNARVGIQADTVTGPIRIQF